jgi:ribosomal protein S12 methylthiotransferase accessory factor
LISLYYQEMLTMATVHVSFPGGVQVTARIGSFTILTDQPPEDGGNNAAPSPYDLFLSSVATCAGFYALRFCQQRQLSTEGLAIALDIDRHPDTRRLETIRMKLSLPTDFPEKYQRAILRSIDQCSVKKALSDPPEIKLCVG